VVGFEIEFKGKSKFKDKNRGGSIMDNDRLLSKQEVVKIIKHEFDSRLKSKDPAFSRYKQLHCVLSSVGFLSVVAVIPREVVSILSFDREISGDVMPMERVQRAVDNNWWDLQRIERTTYYKKMLDEIDSQKN
jgi:hypothetical protein